jgi:hypothetical protein
MFNPRDPSITRIDARYNRAAPGLDDADLSPPASMFRLRARRTQASPAVATAAPRYTLLSDEEVPHRTTVVDATTAERIRQNLRVRGIVLLAEREKR